MKRINKMVLIVDDIDDVRESLALLFIDEGYDVVQASNGLSAIKSIEENDVDLLITDILMPDMDGVELINAAKEICPNLKTIAISGGGRRLSEDNEYDYLRVIKKLTTVDEVLKKPFNPAEILSISEALLV